MQNLSLQTVIKIDGTDNEIKLDFSDKRFVNRLLHLIKKYGNIEEEIQRELEKLDSIEDELDKLLAYSDTEINLLTAFKKDVDDCFGTNITEMMFGDCVPQVERYFDLFSELIPYIEAAKAQENEKIVSINKKYGLDRLKKN